MLPNYDGADRLTVLPTPANACVLNIHTVWADGSLIVLRATDGGLREATVTITHGEESEQFPLAWESIHSAMILRDKELEFPTR